MKFFLLLISLAVGTLGLEEQYCYKEIAADCGLHQFTDRDCNSKYASFNNQVIPDHLRSFAMDHIVDSYIYMLTAVNFGNYDKNRDGFQKYFQKLSDNTWEQAIDIIKFISKRGSNMIFQQRPVESHHASVDESYDNQYEKEELGAMANALSITKKLALKANEIHAKADHPHDLHDAELSSYIEENFVHKHSSLIRELSGHVNDLKKFYGKNDKSLDIFLFDEYLQH